MHEKKAGFNLKNFKSQVLPHDTALRSSPPVQRGSIKPIDPASWVEWSQLCWFLQHILQHTGCSQNTATFQFLADEAAAGGYSELAQFRAALNYLYPKSIQLKIQDRGAIDSSFTAPVYYTQLSAADYPAQRFHPSTERKFIQTDRACLHTELANTREG